MVQHLDKPLQVATLAATANISSSYFFALFKRRIGRAPIDYFARLRMARACRLLKGTSFSVKQVAFELGYDDLFYFSRVFKSVNQIAPSDYRAAHRKTTGRTGTAERAALLQKIQGVKIPDAPNLANCGSLSFKARHQVPSAVK